MLNGRRYCLTAFIRLQETKKRNMHSQVNTGTQPGRGHITAQCAAMNYSGLIQNLPALAGGLVFSKHRGRTVLNIRMTDLPGWKEQKFYAEDVILT